jgi:hypothetical protein
MERRYWLWEVVRNERARRTKTSHQPHYTPLPTMGSTKAFRQSGATSTHGSKMLFYKQSISKTNTKVTHLKPLLAVQEHV